MQTDSKLNEFLPPQEISLSIGGSSFTQLMSACNLGNVERVKLLLSKNASVNIQNDQGVTALMLAAQENGLKYGETHASPSDYNQIVTLLLQHRADAKTADVKNNTVLTYAAWGGNLKVIKQLIDKGSSIDTTSSFGTTMLHAAAASGNVETIQFFLDKGADVNRCSV